MTQRHFICTKQHMTLITNLIALQKYTYHDAEGSQGRSFCSYPKQAWTPIVFVGLNANLRPQKPKGFFFRRLWARRFCIRQTIKTPLSLKADKKSAVTSSIAINASIGLKDVRESLTKNSWQSRNCYFFIRQQECSKYSTFQECEFAFTEKEMKFSIQIKVWTKL